LDPSPLACTVRGCGLSLQRGERTWVCPCGHTYDVARSGYVNLLQPQDRRSLSAGDSKSATEARARLLAAGIGRTILDVVVHRAATLALPDNPLVADFGSGSGDALAEVAGARSIAGVGIDLSTAAAEHAARRFPHLTWVVANADRRLPFIDRSVALILSIHGRRQAVECARVLAPQGYLLVVIPAPDDLIELRALIQGEAIERARNDALVAEHEHLFTLTERLSVRERHTLGRTSLIDLLRGTYRGGRSRTAVRLDTLRTMEITLASDIFLFVPRRSI
jgi:23S rRNA (guanine745-N1)-methyltransferase